MHGIEQEPDTGLMHLHWLQHDVDARWNASPALLKSRQGRPTSAVGLAPQPNSRVLVRADMAVRPDPTLCKRLGGAEDLVHELGGSPTPLARLRPPNAPASVVARVDRAERARAKTADTGRRVGITHRERAILWGTSLAQYQTQVPEPIDSASWANPDAVQAGGGRRGRWRGSSDVAPGYIGGRQKEMTSASLASAAVSSRDLRSHRGRARPDAFVPDEDYQYDQRMNLFRNRVLDALIKNQRQRSDSGAVEACEAAWKQAGGNYQDAKLASTLCCLMRDIGVDRAAIDNFYERHCPARDRKISAGANAGLGANANAGKRALACGAHTAW